MTHTANTAYRQQIVDYYDTCKTDYQIVWHLNSHLSLHYGFWDEKTQTLRQALTQMNEALFSFGEIKEQSIVLDAGCGVGGSTIFLAKNKQCKATGISLSQKQIEDARQNSIKLGVAQSTNFLVQDYCHTHFAANSFDVVWAMESVCHAANKKDFIQETFRLLKPGGKLVMADFFAIDNIHHPLLKDWAQTWAVESFEHIESFKQFCVEVGFESLKIKDVSANVLKSIKRLHYCYYPGLVCHFALMILGKRTALHYQNVRSCKLQYDSFKANLWRYYFVSATKPF